MTVAISRRGYGDRPIMTEEDAVKKAFLEGMIECSRRFEGRLLNHADHTTCQVAKDLYRALAMGEVRQREAMEERLRSGVW